LDIPRQLSDAGVTGNVLLQWHGGEPLLIDPERCEGLIIGLNANTQIIDSNCHNRKMFQQHLLLQKALLC
jgi:sulfatase maturation enzyme AslB (radical SAM superfamily)